MKKKIVAMGTFLGEMVFPNFGVFIAWGVITSLFSVNGWIPNETLSKMITPIACMLLPLLIAYTGGSKVAGLRGGVIGNSIYYFEILAKKREKRKRKCLKKGLKHLLILLSMLVMS